MEPRSPDPRRHRHSLDSVQFHRDGKFSHCGTDVFNLVKTPNEKSPVRCDRTHAAARARSGRRSKQRRAVRRYFNAARQYSTHFLVSSTASEPCGIAYSSSIEAGKVHLFLLTNWRMSLIGVSPVPHGRFSDAVLGQRPILQVVARDPPVELVKEVERRAAAVAARDEVAEIDVRHVAWRDRERLVERGHAALGVRVVGDVDLLLHRPLTEALECRDGVRAARQFERDVIGAERPGDGKRVSRSSSLPCRTSLTA